MDNQPNATQENMGDKNQKDVSADTVNVQGTAVRNLKATNATIRQGSMQSVETDHLVVRQGGMLRAKTDNLEMMQSGAALIRTKDAQLTASNAGVIVMGGNANLDQSAARVLVAGGEVNIDQSASLVMVARTIKTNHSGTLFLIAQNVEGDVKPAFGTRDAFVFGAVAGAVLGVISLLGGLFKRVKG